MRVLRNIKEFELNEGDLHGAASGLYNVSYIDQNGEVLVSDWFDSERRDELLEMDDTTFLENVIGMAHGYSHGS
jgi:hypothetical protein